MARARVSPRAVDLLHDHRGFRDPQARTAVFLGYERREPARLRERLNELLWIFALPIDLAPVRVAEVGAQLPDRRADLIGTRLQAADRGVSGPVAHAAVHDVPLQQQVRGRVGGRHPVRPAQRGARLGEREHGHAVPCRDDLVVAGGLRAPVPRGEQRGPDSLPARRIVGIRGQLQGRRAVLERPLRRDREQLRGPDAVLLAEHLRQLGGRPGVGQTLDAVRVGVQRGGEPALGRVQVPHQELRGLLRHPPGEGRMRARDTGEMAIDPQ